MCFSEALLKTMHFLFNCFFLQNEIILCRYYVEIARYFLAGCFSEAVAIGLHASFTCTSVSGGNAETNTRDGNASMRLILLENIWHCSNSQTLHAMVPKPSNWEAATEMPMSCRTFFDFSSFPAVSPSKFFLFHI